MKTSNNDLTMNTLRSKKCLLPVAVIIVTSCLYLMFSSGCNYGNKLRGSAGVRSGYSVWPKFTVDTKYTQDYFQDHCFRMNDMSIAKLDDFVKMWAETDKPHCRDLYRKFSAMFTISKRDAPLILPKPFQAKVKHWLGDSEPLFQEVYHQHVTHIHNIYTREYTIFNPLRDKRPITKPVEPEREYIERLAANSKVSCDFCNYLNSTAEHLNHRIESRRSFSASNTFKLDKWHALFMTRKHHPLNWDQEDLLDLMNLSVRWFQRSHRNDSSAKYAMLVWDMFPHAGASQIHPHTHGLLSPEKYHGTVEAWRMGAEDYYQQFSSNYFSDLISIYNSMDLSVRLGDAVAFANLVPKKDYEIVIMSATPGKNFFQLLYYAIRAYVDDLDKLCYSMGIALPPMGTDKGSIPAYARIVTRGGVAEVRTDMSSLELFAGTNVNVDPYKAIKAMKRSILRRHKDDDV